MNTNELPVDFRHNIRNKMRLNKVDFNLRDWNVWVLKSTLKRILQETL